MCLEAACDGTAQCLTSFNTRYDGQVSFDVPQHGEVHVVVRREGHCGVERHQYTVCDHDQSRLDGSVTDPPLLRRRNAHYTACSRRPHVPVKALREQPVVGKVVRRPVALRLIPTHRHRWTNTSTVNLYTSLQQSIKELEESCVHSTVLPAKENKYLYCEVCLFVCLGFNGTFSTNRLYRAITVG